MSSSGTTGTVAGIVTVLGLGALFLLLLFFILRLSKQWKMKLLERIMKAIKRRRNANDPFRKRFGYSWDYFIAFRVYDEDDPISELQQMHSFRHVLNQLTAGGMELRLFYSLQKKEVFCKIRAPLTRLQKHADLVDFQMLFDSQKLKDECEKGRDGLWDPIHIPETSVMTNIPPYNYIYGKYCFDGDIGRTRDDLRRLYKRWPKVTPESLARSYNLNSTDMTNLTSNPLASLDHGPNMSLDAGAISLTDIYGKGSITTAQQMQNFANTPPPEASRDSFMVDQNLDEDTEYSEAAMFRGVDRLKLIHQIISYKGIGGCYLDPAQLLKDECILAYSPLHDMVELRELEAEWLTFFDFPWNQPVDKIKNYFGEKIGLYFKWLGFYTTWLIPAAILGFCVWIDVATDNNSPDATSVPYFAGIMALWSALFIEFWKRTENTTAMKWGTNGYEEMEQVRPQFKGEKIRSAITGHPALYFSRVSRFYRSVFSQTVISFLVLIVIAVIAIIFAIRIGISDTGANIGGVNLGGIVSSILLALQIQFLNGFFGEIALKLTNFENHRTDTEYEDSLIAKTFCFQFVNSFASLFYIAFVKPYIPTIDPCMPGGCMTELQVTLGTIFLTRLAMGNLTEIGIPLLKSYFEESKRTTASNKLRDSIHRETMEQVNILRQSKDSGVKIPDHFANTVNLDSDAVMNDLTLKYEMSEIEKTFTMAVYDVMLGTFDDYAEMAIQFGYTTMFVAAFPLATVLSFINNYVEIRVDGWKLCHLCRRPEPRSCEDIGTWLVILELMSISSIFINSGLIAFTGSNAINYTWVDRVWIFILIACGLFAIRFTVAFLIPDEPEEVQIQLKRREYITDKIINNIADEGPDENTGANFETPSFIVLKTDDDPM